MTTWHRTKASGARQRAPARVRLRCRRQWSAERDEPRPPERFSADRYIVAIHVLELSVGANPKDRKVRGDRLSRGTVSHVHRVLVAGDEEAATRTRWTCET